VSRRSINYYRILEVDPRASTDVIHAAYRTLAKNYKDDGTALRQLNIAKEVLLDKDARKQYDKSVDNITGKIIGDYRVVERIASGGFATTYLAKHIETDLPVCIKHAHEISSIDESLMLQEVATIWDLRHWAIPAIRGWIRLADKSIAIIMSYIPGPTLAHIVSQNGGLDSEHVCWITERVLNALRYLHSCSVVHGDVKPQNIIIQPITHQVVLVDYGLSLVRPKKDSSNKGYTPDFASPEQIKGMPLIPESDLYGLGVTMIYALGGNIKALQVPNHVPEPICKFILKLIGYDPLNRPNWSTEDLCQTISDVRQTVFGRRFSEMKPLPGV
jgi:serine/threonine protein kinase